MKSSSAAWERISAAWNSEEVASLPVLFANALSAAQSAVAAASGLGGLPLAIFVTEDEVEELASRREHLARFCGRIHLEAEQWIDKPFFTRLNSLLQIAYETGPSEITASAGDVSGQAVPYALEDLFAAGAVDEALRRDWAQKLAELDADEIPADLAALIREILGSGPGAPPRPGDPDFVGPAQPPDRINAERLEAPRSQNLTDAEVQALKEAFLRATGGTKDFDGAFGAQCVDLIAWLISTLPGLKYGGGDGGDVAYNLADVNGLPLLSAPVVGSVFGTRDYDWYSRAQYGRGSHPNYHCSSGRAGDGNYIGHTGVVVAIDGNRAQILHSISGVVRVDWVVWVPGQSVEFVDVSPWLK